ncbi:MAG: hypothetical protein V3T30_08605 [Thermodesulfobacteriota bacterium]
MDCLKARELIATDYFDGESASEDFASSDGLTLYEHMEGCPECTKFAVGIREAAVEPFKDVERAVLPPEIWQAVSAGIAEEKEKAVRPATKVSPQTGSGFAERVFASLGLRKSAMAAGAVAASIIIAVLIGRGPAVPPVPTVSYLAGDAEFIVMLNTDEAINGDYMDMGTKIEEYFL